MSNVLTQMRAKALDQVEVDRRSTPLADLKGRIADQPSTRPFSASLMQNGKGIIAEFKRFSPSKGPMRIENVERAIAAYEKSHIVRAISVLTHADFGGTVNDLAAIRRETHKPILRKDFIVDEYQVYQARAMGADAILLMMQDHHRGEMNDLFCLAKSMDLEVLIECRTKEDIDNIPEGAEMVGINSRQMMSKGKRFAWSRKGPFVNWNDDFTTNLRVFREIDKLPEDAVKIAESGLTPANIKAEFERGFNACLIGGSLLLDPRGIEAVLNDYESVIQSLQGAVSAPTNFLGSEKKALV